MLKRLKEKGEGWQRMRWLESITYSMDINLGKLSGIVRDGTACHGVAELGTLSD